MEREERELLFRDLSARLPYRTRIQLTEYSVLTGEKLPSETRILDYYTLGKVQAYCRGVRKDEVRPYLFPMSSMTEEQEAEWYDRYITPLCERMKPHTRKEDLMLSTKTHYVSIFWLLENHFDYLGLIEKGLAIDATGLDVY